jgi:hypothetical protein
MRHVFEFTVRRARDVFTAGGRWFTRITGPALTGFGFSLAPECAAD